MNSISTNSKSEETLESVGKILKQARLNHKVRDLNAIAEDLCIKPHLLEALEQGDFGSFASSCYATGFLKNYANFLGLDTKDVVAKYEAEFVGSNECVVLTFPEAEKHNSLPVKSVAGITTFCVAIFLGVWASYDRIDAEEVSGLIEPTRFHSSAAEVVPVSEEKQEKVAVVATDEMRLKANQDVWVRLSESDGTVVVEKILNKGEDLVTPKTQGLSLMTNNAAALSVHLDGGVVNALGNEGEIIESIVLEEEKLLELTMLR